MAINRMKGFIDPFSIIIIVGVLGTATTLNIAAPKKDDSSATQAEQTLVKSENLVAETRQ